MSAISRIEPTIASDRLIATFGARIEAALARIALENARKDAMLDAFLGNRCFLDARRDERGVYVAR